MEVTRASKIIKDAFESQFNKENFYNFINQLLKNIEGTTFIYKGAYIKDDYKDFVKTFERVGKFSTNNKEIDILIVQLKDAKCLERARSKQRNFIASYLNGSMGGKQKDAALVAFYAPDAVDWRFSFVKMDYNITVIDDNIKVKGEFSSAKRFSFLVGKNEKIHTAESRFLPLIISDNKPSFTDIEKAFDVEIVSDEFFKKYRDLFVNLKSELDKLYSKDEKLQQEFISKNITTVDFAKKLLGQIIFLYFLQKKGWFGVAKNQSWGTGPKDFIRKLFAGDYVSYDNFYTEILEPLFYEALRTDRAFNNHFYDKLQCKIPFLNGGLFDPINNYDWLNNEIKIPNEIFSNNNKTKEGDIGDGILDIFDKYNFTVNEDEPLEKEVALDPELLGKIYEKLNAIRDDNFDEYYIALKSGRVRKETKFNKEYGVYYTPRDIVHYICQKSLINYLFTNLNGKVPKKDIMSLVKNTEINEEYETIAIEKEQKIKQGDQKHSRYCSKIPDSIKENAKDIDQLLANITVCDPAIGSGAFPIGMMHEIVKLRQLLSVHTANQINTYDLKRYCIENSLYGVDIDLGAIETCKLRFWLSLIVDEDDFADIRPLPNLDYKIVCGNSLLGYPNNYKPSGLVNIEKLKKEFFDTTNPVEKNKLKKTIDESIDKLLKNTEESFGYRITMDFTINFSEVFSHNGGFDLVIGNPPYISTKGYNQDDKQILKYLFGFADDFYSHFIFKGIDILKNNGILAFITSKTYWTIQTKKNLRELLLKNKILEIYDTGNPFDAPIVDTAIVIVQKNNEINNYKFIFIDGKNDFMNPDVFVGDINLYKNAPNNVFFIPNETNIKIANKYFNQVQPLLDKWWDKISTSKNIEKYYNELEKYRNSLKPGDITLLGLITEGGQGLATANNGKYVGVKEGTKLAENVKKERPEKLLLAAEFCKQNNIKTKQEAEDFINKLNEFEIREKFDEIKEKYGRDIFGQGWLYRIVGDDEIADVDSLTDDDKLNGITGDKTFVPYEKGDKDGNRWYAPTPYYIDWSRQNVKFLKENSGKKGEGMPVVRNPQFYFREGFCWNNVTGVNIKCRIKAKSLHSTEAMSLFTLNDKLLPNFYFICLLNSNFFGIYKNNFLNISPHLTTGDAKEFPIIIPSNEQLNIFENIFNHAVEIQKDKFAGKISVDEVEVKLAEIQKELDKFVEGMYLE